MTFRHFLTRQLTRFNPKYPHSLLYLLQSTEYYLDDYFTWYFKITNFTTVEKRRQLHFTLKTKIFLLLLWLIIALSLFFSAWLLIQQPLTFSISLIFCFVSLLLPPFLLPYLLAALSFLFDFLIQKPVTYFKVTQAQKKLALHPGFKIAIAGSYGKTSMRQILAETLSIAKKVATPPDNYNTPLGISQFINQLQGNEEILIFELGEYYPGDIRKLCQLIQPDLGIITGVNASHLKRFKTLQKTTQTIFELADYLRPDQTLYVNHESTLAAQAVHFSSHRLFYDRHQISSRWKITNSQTNLQGSSFTMTHQKTKLHLHSQLLGLHQIGPLAVAADIAFNQFNFTPEQIKQGIAQIKPISHRLQPKPNSFNQTTILDDSYNGNPDGVAAIIDFLTQLPPDSYHHRFYVTPGLVEIGSATQEVHRQIGQQLATAKIEKVVLIKNSVTPYIAQGLHDSNFQGEIIWFEDTPTALNSLHHLSLPHDLIILQNDWPDQYQ